ncbi:BTAD domain-containing putative transcriptional regulator [Nocardia sp. SSK8]|uniref:BTAD domain-containing putative transcriptional regulator n=1 Tax=Nocardia sp. SSK8 TaxID=3120154 RepID=UPI003009AAE4
MQIGMLGPLEIRTGDGESREIPGVRVRALVIALALEPGRVVPKAKLIDWVWGERPPAEASNALQALVSRLRRVLPEGVVAAEGGGYRLAVDPGAVDAVRFEELLGRARSGDDAQRVRLLREALRLWRGTPLPDLGETAATVITRLDGLRLAAREDLYEAEIRLGRGPELVAELTSVLAEHPGRERLAGSAMRALAAAGRGTEALAVYQRLRENLADELGVDPAPELSALHVALLRGEAGQRPARQPTTNLRAELSSFVGRHTEIERVRDLLAAHRLTTLTGPGGAGKTRLAVESARTLLDTLPDGVWLVELAGIEAGGDPAPQALAALGLRDALLGSASPADPVDRLIAALRDRDTLLVLDNCEHVIDAAAAFAHRLLGACTRLRILATSREPLGITGEALWQVEPLAVPAADAIPARIESAPAVALLRDRAAAVRTDLPTDPDSLATMARLCRALDGIPLAIELAAARLRTLSLDELAHRLDDRFRLLTGGSRTAIAQHRTLRAVVDWSWELLSDPERQVLRRLAVFAGGASLDAAEQVCAGAAVARAEVLDLLTALTEKSLLRAAADGSPRFRMLETIRRYAADRLAESGETETVRRAHLDHITTLAATAEPHLRRAEQLEWLTILAADHDNIAAALRAALSAGDAAGSMRLAAAAGWYWWLSGHKGEGTELITAAAALPGPVDDETRALVYGLIVHFVTSGRDDEQQVADWIRAAHRFGRDAHGTHPALRFTVALERMLRGPSEFLPAFEALLTDDDPWVRALARLQLGKLRTVLGHAGSEPDEYLAAALTEFRALGERWGMSFALTELANRTAQRGDFAHAITLFDEAVAVVTEAGTNEDAVAMRARQAQLFARQGDTAASAAALADAQRLADTSGWPTARAEVALARAELARGSHDPALAHQQLALARTLLGADADRPVVQAMVHTTLGYLADDPAIASTHHATAFTAATTVGHAPLLATVLVGLADLALRRDRPGHAAHLLAASTAVRGLPDRSHPDIARIEQTAREHLGDKGFADAQRVGSTTDPAELVAAVLAG